MITIKNLCKSYGDQVLFDDCNFQLNDGERIGIVGRNGHGKTTLLRLLQGLEEPDGGEIETPRDYTLGFLEQHLRFTQPTILDEGCQGLPEAERHESWRVEKILAGLGFANADLDRSPAEFSGGFQVRLHLAKVLVAQPDCLVLDEPTNYLDVIAIRWLIGFLRAWRGELLLVTHDRGFMDQVTTHTLAIHRRSFRKIEGGTEKMYAQIAQDEEVYEKTRRNDARKRAVVEQFITRFRAKARLAGLVQSRVKLLAKQEPLEKLQTIESLEFSFTDLPFAAQSHLGVDGLAFGYTPEHPLIENFSIHVAPGDRIGVIGQNGRGKTTLLRLFARELAPQAGILRPHPDLRIGYYGQTNVDRLQPGRTVVDEILAGATGCSPQRARDLAGLLLFSGDDGLKQIKVLSGGERARVLLGKLLATPAHLLLLDEPTNHLDMESCDSLLAAVDAFAGAVVMVTHNEMFLHTLATRLIVFDRGRVFLYEGGYQRFLEDIGWGGDEETGAGGRRESPGPAARRAEKRARAEYIQKRGLALRPLERSVKDLEERVRQLDAESAAVEAGLIAASASGAAKKIAALNRRRLELGPASNAAYAELEIAMRRLEVERARWPEP